MVDNSSLELGPRNPGRGPLVRERASAGTREPLAAHLQPMRQQHDQDLWRGLGSVVLPRALERKYPRAAFE